MTQRNARLRVDQTQKAGRGFDMADEAALSVPWPTPDIPCGRATAWPPAGGRHMWAVVTSRCPWCGSGHVHRTGLTARLLSGRVLRRCPVWHRQYTLAPVRRGREARRPVGVA